MTDGPGPGEGSVKWRIRGARLALDRPLVMGILNLTPDSFSDGGELDSIEKVLRRAERHLSEGASILDLGGESTRPGAEEITVEEEIRRVIPAVEAITARWSVPLSIDTRRADVARGALEAGAHIVNDVSGFAFDPALAGVVAEAGAGAVLMHMRGTPLDMVSRARYDDPVVEVCRELGDAVDRAKAAGFPDDALVLDPGLGFAKTADQSLRLLRDLRMLVGLGYPILVGPSRKSFLGEVLDLPPSERVIGTAVACALARSAGARIFRVHDVRETMEALQVATAIDAGSVAEGRAIRPDSVPEAHLRAARDPGPPPAERAGANT
jgi:dihydropteroate synthase